MKFITPVLRRAGWLAAGLLAFGVAFEATARVEDLIRYGMPLAAPYRSEVDLVVHDSLGMHGRPGAQYLKWSLNSLGTRGPEVSRQRQPGVLRVVTTGASETFGQSEAPGREYPRQLEDSLKRYLRQGALASFGSAEVLNAAFFGMSLPTATQDVHLRVAGFEPQFVVLYPTSVQYLNDELPTAVEPAAGPGALTGCVGRPAPPRAAAPARGIEAPRAARVAGTALARRGTSPVGGASAPGGASVLSLRIGSPLSRRTCVLSWVRFAPSARSRCWRPTPTASLAAWPPIRRS